MSAAAVFEMGQSGLEALDDLPLDTRFTLGDKITPLQEAFLERRWRRQ